IDPALWVRVNLGDRCEAAQCTLRAPATRLATRRHYHAKCDHRHGAGAKAGMRFHHHQLEKIRKHQRVHARRAAAASAEEQTWNSPSAVPPDVTEALAAAGLELHDVRVWSAAATDRLRGLVEAQQQRTSGGGAAGRVAWEAVAAALAAERGEGEAELSAAQCMLQWRAVVNQGATVTGVGTWCEPEDKRLAVLVAHFNQAWSSVARYMPGREPKQCRERFNNVVNPALLRSGPWTPEEDALLESMMQQTGHRFADAARCLPGHSYNDVKNRFNTLQRAKNSAAAAAAAAAGGAAPA
ncbi:hypothetical protein JKP88DRAFT_154799, partial [Tribonema minus]